jgi:hypothetical protein
MTSFETSIEFGERYRDKNSGYEGVATALYFYEFGCARVSLVSMDDKGDVKDLSFDEQSLVKVGTGKPVEAFAKVGGARPAPAPRADGTR